MAQQNSQNARSSSRDYNTTDAHEFESIAPRSIDSSGTSSSDTNRGNDNNEGQPVTAAAARSPRGSWRVCNTTDAHELESIESSSIDNSGTSSSDTNRDDDNNEGQPMTAAATETPSSNGSNGGIKLRSIANTNRPQSPRPRSPRPTSSDIMSGKFHSSNERNEDTANNEGQSVTAASAETPSSNESNGDSELRSIASHSTRHNTNRPQSPRPRSPRPTSSDIMSGRFHWQCNNERNESNENTNNNEPQQQQPQQLQQQVNQTSSTNPVPVPQIQNLVPQNQNPFPQNQNIIPQNQNLVPQIRDRVISFGGRYKIWIITAARCAFSLAVIGIVIYLAYRFGRRIGGNENGDERRRV